MPDTRLRVCMVSPLPPPYGGISHWTAMVSRYAGERNDLDLNVVNTASHWRPVHDFSLWKRVIGGSLQLLRNLFWFCVTLLVRRPNVVHLTTSGELGVFRDLGIMLIAELCRVPVIYHIRFGRVPKIAAEGSREWNLLACAMRKAHTVMPIDCSTEDAVRDRLPEVRLARIPNCVNLSDLAQQNNNASPDHRAVFIGWVIPSKGIRELIEAWARLKRSDWKLYVIGPGDRAYRAQLLDTYGPEGVSFLGELPHGEAIKCLGQAEVFVLPSYTEGFPNVVIEAMALGKAIIATRVGAIPEMLGDGCGLLVDAGNTEELADALRRLFEDEQLRTLMGGRARDRAISEFSIEAVFEKYLGVWRQAARNGY